MRPPVLLMVCAAAAASAQAPPPSQFTLRDATVDLAVPESPAFTALGLTPQQVSRPSSPRQLAASLLNGVDREGNFQTGIAIDTAPYMLAAGPQIQLREYQKRSQYLTRFLARAQTSFATAKGSSAADKSVKLALGLRFTFFDLGDPRGDNELLKCLERETAKVLESAPPVPPNADVDIENRRREEAVRTAVKPCRDAAAKRRWNRSAWIAGVSPTWTSPDGTSAQTQYGGTALWSSLGFGFENVPVLREHAMIAAYVKGRNKETVPDRFNAGHFVTQNNVTAGGRWLFGGVASQVNIEGLWVRNNRADRFDDRYWRLAFGFEQKLVENTWLNLSFGRELGRRASDNAYFVMGSYNWGFGSK